METQVTPSGNECMGFGKHAHMKYEEVLIQAPSYTQWCITTATENPESYWRMKRFALWAQGVGTTEKEQMTRRVTSASQRGYPAASSMAAPRPPSPSVTTDKSWEVTQDLEMIPGEAMERINLLEAELARLRQEVANRDELTHKSQDTSSKHQWRTEK